MRDINMISKSDGIYWRIFMDVFKFMKTHFNAGQKNADEWIALSDDAGDLADRYGPQYFKFTSGLLHGVIADIEDAFKASRKEGMT